MAKTKKKVKRAMAAAGKEVAADAKIVMNTAVGAAVVAGEAVSHAVHAIVEKVSSDSADKATK